MKAEECGLVRVQGKRRYTVEQRVIERGRHKGQVEATLVNGQKHTVYPEQVLRKIRQD